MSGALMPTLTRLDERVLDALPPVGTPGVRLSAIVRALRREPVDDVRGVLRGLEHLGLACNANGWWSR